MEALNLQKKGWQTASCSASVGCAPRNATTYLRLRYD